MNYKIYVVEDMAMTRASIISTLEENNFIVTGSSAEAEKAWQEIKSLTIDIVLIDINLAGKLNGIWLATKIKSELNLPIIFLTAYGDSKTLKEIKDVKPNGYILKPFNVPTLITNINIALQNFNTKKHSNLNDTVTIKSEGKQVFLPINEIYFIMSNGNYIEIKHKLGRYVIREKLILFLDKLPPKTFIQVHRRYVINLDKIKAINSNLVWIEEKEIPISDSYRKKLHEMVRLK